MSKNKNRHQNQLRAIPPETEALAGTRRAALISWKWLIIVVAVVTSAAGILFIGILIFAIGFKPNVDAANAKMFEIQQKIGALNAKTDTVDARIKEIDDKTVQLNTAILNARTAIAKAEAHKKDVDRDILLLDEQIRALNEDPKKIVDVVESVRRMSVNKPSEDATLLLQRIKALEDSRNTLSADRDAMVYWILKMSRVLTDSENGVRLISSGRGFMGDVQEESGKRFNELSQAHQQPTLPTPATHPN